MKRINLLLIVFITSMSLAGDKHEEAIKHFNSIGEKYESRYDGISFKNKQRCLDNDLKYLKDFKKLRTVILTKCNITDEAFVHFQDLKDLEFLRLEETKINGSGFKYLANMKKLGTIWAYKTNVNDEALQYLSKLDGLWELNLGGTKVSDKGLYYLRNLNLKNLTLFDTKVTDKGLKYLYKMDELSYLNLNGTKCTKRGKKDLEKHVPSVNIDLDD